MNKHMEIERRMETRPKRNGDEREWRQKGENIGVGNRVIWRSMTTSVGG